MVFMVEKQIERFHRRVKIKAIIVVSTLYI